MDFLISGVLLWGYFGTSYQLTSTDFIYKYGPLKGQIPINSIRKITKSKILYSGFKPATALNGLMIYYNTYDNIYISPKTNTTFIKELVKINPGIQIVDF